METGRQLDSETIAAAVEHLAAVGTDAESMSGAEAAGTLDDLCRLEHQLTATITAVARRWDRCGEWAADGSKSAAARLARDQRVSKATARKMLCRASALAEMPVAAAAFTAGRLTGDQVRDRHCQHSSGCDEPISRCDTDHDLPHHRGGPTELWNGLLKCFYHNRIWPHGAQPPPR